MTNTQQYNPNDYVFFWHGHLSNFYQSLFTVDNVTYICSEQYFMKKKQELFDKDNLKLANDILYESNPKKIKDYGRQVNNFDQDTWDKNKVEIMKKGVREKFSQNTNLKKLLIETGDKILVEASPFDKIWGIGLSEEVAKVTHPSKWKGQNLLGNILMEVRTELKS